MNRFREYGRLDDAPEVFGDVGFNRLDMQSDPATLPPGALAANRNMRFDVNGNQVRAGNKLLLPPGSNLSQTLFAGFYTPVKGFDQHALVLSDRLVLFDSTSQTLATYFYPPTETISTTDPVALVQAGVDAAGALPTLYILRGFSKDTLKFDGSTIVTDPTFPRGTMALYYQDRIAVNPDYQSLKVSDFLDFETFVLLNQFQIEKGGADYLVGMMAYQGDYVLIGSRRKWFMAFFDPNIGTGGYSGGLTDSSFLRLLTGEAGPVGPRAMTNANGKIWFIADKAIYAFVPQLDQTLTVLGRPVSADIQPIMDRMSANYANNACLAHYGYRLYCAMPISDEAIAVSSIAVTAVETQAALPTTLPFALSMPNTATAQTSTAHGLSAGDLVQVSGSPTASLNGIQTVLSVPDSTHFSYGTNASTTASVGSAVTAQKLATRNNMIAVYNFKVEAWESIDTLPTGFYADWMGVADYGNQRRLMIVDAAAGPALYEEADQDDVQSFTGGIKLPTTLDFNLSEMDYVTAPIAGYVKSRTLRWQQLQVGSYSLTAAYPRRVRKAEARFTCQTGDTGTFTMTVSSPNRQAWTKSRTFPISSTTDAGVPIRCGKRGLEVVLEVNVTGGRPVLRALEVETTQSGRVED